MEIKQLKKGPRSIICEEIDVLKIAIPKKRNWITFFLFFGVLLYLFIKFIRFPYFFSNYFAIVFGLIILVMIGYLILLSAGGTEEIYINGKELIKTRRLFGIKVLLGNHFNLTHIKNFRFVPRFFWPLPEHIGIQKGR
jgi:hypothetical protein